MAHLGVLDEVEYIRAALDHLAAIGVDHIIVCDMGSTDGTLDILERRRGRHLDVIEMPYDASWDEWHRAAIDAVKAAEGDWALFLDADEFWLPSTGSLEACLSGHAPDVLVVDRFNVALSAAGPCLPDDLTPENYGRVLLYCRHRIESFRRHLELTPDVPWIRAVPMPKVIARTASIGAIAIGTHDVVSTRPVRRERARDVIIAHVPFSTEARFRRRACNISRFLKANPDYFQGDQAWHWRCWAAAADREQIASEFARQALDADQMAALRARGDIMSAHDLLRL